MIEVTNLVKKYSENVAVNNLSFTVDEGQVYGLLGPNGAGKTTTMNIITGYMAATSGEVKIDGKDIYENAVEAKKNIGYLPEHPPLYLDMNPREYLEFAANLKLIPKSERKAQVEKVMEITGCAHMSDRLIKNLSKGYRQRVGFAQAILGDPKVIILDEPTVGLDPIQVIEIRELIKDLGKRHTVIFSSHILSEVSTICDHVMIISKGNLVASDTPENLSRKILGSGSVMLTARGLKKDIRNALMQIDEIVKIEFKEPEEPGTIRVLTESKKDMDVREKIFYRMHEAGCPILSMRNVNASLEEVFLELTSNEQEVNR